MLAIPWEDLERRRIFEDGMEAVYERAHSYREMHVTFLIECLAQYPQDCAWMLSTIHRRVDEFLEDAPLLIEVEPDTTIRMFNVPDPHETNRLRIEAYERRRRALIAEFEMFVHFLAVGSVDQAMFPLAMEEGEAAFTPHDVGTMLRSFYLAFPDFNPFRLKRSMAALPAAPPTPPSLRGRWTAWNVLRTVVCGIPPAFHE